MVLALEESVCCLAISVVVSTKVESSNSEFTKSLMAVLVFKRDTVLDEMVLTTGCKSFGSVN